MISIKILNQIFSQNKLIFIFKLIIAKIKNIFNNNGVGLKILSPKDTLKYLKKTNKSLLRWGDGDTNGFYQGYVYYQDPNKKFRKIYLDILNTYNKNSPYLIAVPSKINLNNIELRKNKELQFYSMTKELFRKYGKRDMKYGDTLLFYSREVKLKDLNSLWKNATGLIIIHFDRNVFNYFKKKYPNKKFIFIRVPEKNAANYYKAYETQINDFIKFEKLNSKNIKIIISAGPLARILLYKYSLKGYIGYDLGVLLGNTKNEKSSMKNNFNKKKFKSFSSPK